MASTNPGEKEFAEMVKLLAAFSEAETRLKELQAYINGQLLNLVGEHKAEYSKLQRQLTNAETALEAISRAHPEWFSAKKSLKTPYGAVSFRRSPRLESTNEEATILLLRAEQKARPDFNAEDYIRSSEVPNYEALEKLDEGLLAQMMVKRVVDEKFSVSATAVDMGKAVAQAAGAKTAQGAAQPE